MAIHIVKGDLTKMETDAVVNAANGQLQRGGGVCGALFAKADGTSLQKACNALAPIQTGEAVMTESYGLPAKYIIHAVGPIWSGGNRGEKKQLKSAYENSLKIGLENNLSSIAFPLLSAGIYGYPKEEAMEVAVFTIQEFLKEHPMDIYLVLLEQSLVEMGNKLLK